MGMYCTLITKLQAAFVSFQQNWKVSFANSFIDEYDDW